MSTYTYSLSTDFGNDINISKFIYEILRSSITPVLVGVEIDVDDVNVTFESSLTAGQITTLNTLVLNHTATETTDNLGDRTSKVNATIAPTTSNDITQNYEPGSIWVDQTNVQAYMCISAATGAANWSNLTATTLSNFEASSTVNASTTSTTYVVITTMTLTPGAGTYFVSFSASGSPSAGTNDSDYAIHSNATIVSHSTRHLAYDGGAQTSNYRVAMHTQAIVTVTAGQAIDVRYKTNAGTFTVYSRSLSLLKLS